MIDERLEFLISQYADGTLPDAERAVLELRLAEDAEARALLEQYQSLDGSLRDSMPLPAIDWDRLAGHLSEAVAEQREPRAATVLGRIGMWRGAAARLAIAACITLAVAGVVWMQWGSQDRQLVIDPAQPSAASAQAVVIVRGPAPEAPTSAPVVAISVGPADTVTPDWRIGEGVVTGPSRAVWIATGSDPAQDTQRLPY